MNYDDAIDRLIATWLAAISPIVCQASLFSPVSISIHGQTLRVVCQHQYMAYRLRKYHKLLQGSGYGLEILVGDERYAFIPPVSTPKNHMTIISQNPTLQNSQWAALNSTVIDLMSDDGTVSVHGADRDSGYPLLTISPYLKIEETLCLPIDQLVGKAVLDAWDKTRRETEVIAVTKRRVIEDAIASGGKITHTYEMTWRGLLWEKAITGVLVGNNEVLCITRSLQEYQRKFWENWTN